MFFWHATGRRSNDKHKQECYKNQARFPILHFRSRLIYIPGYLACVLWDRSSQDTIALAVLLGPEGAAGGHLLYNNPKSLVLLFCHPVLLRCGILLRS
jgi:hypothetical protein